MLNKAVLVLVYDRVYSLLCKNTDLDSLFDNVYIKPLSGFTDLGNKEQYQLLGSYGHIYILPHKAESLPSLLSDGVFQVNLDQRGCDELSGIMDVSEIEDDPGEHITSTLMYFLHSKVASFLMELQKNEISMLREKSSSCYFALETIKTVSTFENESEAIRFTREFFEMMCMPENIVYYSNDDLDSLARDVFLIDFTLDEILSFLGVGNEYILSSSGRSYCFRVFSHNGDKGLFIIEKVAYPERINECLNLALGINNVLSITLENIEKH